MSPLVGPLVDPLAGTGSADPVLALAALAGLLAAAALAVALVRVRSERAALLARVGAQAAEAESRDTFTSTVLSSTDAGIVVVDPEGRPVLLNDTARAWHGLGPDARLDASGHACARDLYGPDGTTPLPAHEVPVQRVLREGFVRGLEVVVAPAGRRPRRVTCSGRVMRTADGACLGAVVVMQDVTAERAREQALVAAHVELAERTQELADRGEELERSNTELEQFAGIASHDLSSPLAVVSGYLEMLGEVHGEAIGEQGRGWVEAARRGVVRMTELMDSLLSYSQTGGTGRRELADLGEVARLAVHDLDAAVRAAGASVRVPADLPAVYCDPVLLRQLLQNLVGNAVKYRDPHRPCAVAVTAAPDGAGGWEVAVVDNGTGIPAEHRERVFEMYAQVDPSARTGHGIGLATCQRIVARHGGRIRAEETPGGGTTVRFTLPQRPPARRGDGAVPVSAGPGRGTCPP
ncbi:sensor histidine kinase [Kineococcus indalonis]|uniref:sensor histidine kinase n=1 Tax=Kineococcus indalonis TaxID=2696566 RepID=UPI001412D4A5|nr:ATP-binding protein [Kineococcus indalonis]NAZ87164.1 PAS domain-containing protein [Kineococcus indalonis]